MKMTRRLGGFKLSVVSFEFKKVWKKRKKERGGARRKTVGVPTWLRDVVVTIGAGTTRRAAVASGAGMIRS